MQINMWMKTITAVAAIAVIAIASGCWNKRELPEYAFVQAVAVDLVDGQVLLSTHFYKPGGGMGEDGGPDAGGFVVRSIGNTVFEAVRDITIHLGRMAQWSHMRIILVGEQAAADNRIHDILDFFQRDHEPREGVIVAIAEGEAGSYLSDKAIIESTIGQQLREMNTTAFRSSAKTKTETILGLAIRMRSETQTALLPYLYREKPPLDSVSFAGTAVVKQGKLVGRLSPQQTKYTLMFRNEFERGILEFDCKEYPEMKNALENVQSRARISVTPAGENVTVKLQIKLQASYGELRCLSIQTPQEEQREISRIKQELEKEMNGVIQEMQRRKFDLLDIGDRLYRKHPTLWQRWKKDWDAKFAAASIELNVDLRITNSGMLMPRSN